MEERKADVDCQIVTTSYYDAYGKLVGTAVTKFGVATGTFTGSYATKVTVTQGYIIPDAPIILCPTGGFCNDCSEYRPRC